MIEIDSFDMLEHSLRVCANRILDSIPHWFYVSQCKKGSLSASSTGNKIWIWLFGYLNKYCIEGWAIGSVRKSVNKGASYVLLCSSNKDTQMVAEMNNRKRLDSSFKSSRLA